MVNEMSIPESIHNEVYPLIFSKQEGSYWDFKREWHKCKSNLLHDIICMANNLADHDAYIIIGIDQENDYSPCDLNNDPNRRNTQNLVDFLKDKKFAGGIRPTAYVQSIPYYDNEIDVIVIKNSHSTPYYLTEKYENVSPNNIYTRVMDTNTPINKTADINNVEYLWQKRFYLNTSPLERLTQYLRQPKEWKSIPCTDDGRYYKYAPEFTITDEPDDEGRTSMFFHFSQIDATPHWYNIYIKYHSTMLLHLLGHALDGGRCFVVSPEMNGISFSERSSWDVCYFYFIEDSCPYLLNQLYQNANEYNPDPYAFQRYMECILVFMNRQEQLSFEEFVKQNREQYASLCGSKEIIGRIPAPFNQDSNKESYRKQFIDSLVLQKMLLTYRGTSIES